VSSADNGVRVDQGATAEMAARDLDADDEGQVALGGSDTTNNIGGVLVPVVGDLLRLREGRSRDEGRSREGDENGFGVHVGWTGEREAGEAVE
jgi:hypothetical protein